MKRFNLTSLIYLIGHIFFGLNCFAQNTTSNNLPNVIYYDADDNVLFNKNEGIIELNKNATILFGKVYINASKIKLLNKSNMIIAEGNVKLIYEKEKAVASRIVLDTLSNQIRMDDATIFSDPSSTDDTLNKNVLGLSKAEIAFDHDKKIRVTELENQLKKFRDEYTNLKNLLQLKKNDENLKLKLGNIIDRYAQLLARHSRTEYQPNTYLEAIPESEKNKYLNRRQAVSEFSKNNKNTLNQIINFNIIPGYISVSASKIFQKDSHSFLLNNSIITPCHCSKMGEAPIYSFSSRNAQIEIGDDITLNGMSLDLFSVPIFYAPWFILSIKKNRHYGFLYPSTFLTSDSKSAFSFPFFIPFGDHADSTLTFTNYNSRGNQFDLEIRSEINNIEKNVTTETSTQFYTKGKYIKDRKYLADYNLNKNNIDNLISQNPDNKLKYKNFEGSPLEQRWYMQNHVIAPINENLMLKLNNQITSDNNFIADFFSSATNDPTNIISSDTNISSNRFLSHEFDAEYYGENVGLSLRTQGLQDLFQQDQKNTPMRLPRMEFTLFPKKYFNLPFVFSEVGSIENIGTPGGNLNYLSLQINTNQTKQLSDKNVQDPYIQGQRLYSQSNVSISLPENNYINGSLSATETSVVYFYPPTKPNNSIQTAQGFLQYQLNIDAPIYFEHDFKNKDINSKVTQNLKPFVNFTYIPHVYRGADFPRTFQQWYAQDNSLSPSLNILNLVNTSISKSAYLTLGASTSWRIQKGSYVKSNMQISRFLNHPEPPVADLNYFAEIEKNKIENSGLNITTKSVYKLTSASQANQLFKDWAIAELDGYYQKVLSEDLNQTYLWPTDSYFQYQSILDITPIVFSIYTNYNFLSDETAKEQNSRAGILNTPYPSIHQGDLFANLALNLQPYIPLFGNLILEYSPFYHRLANASTSIGTNLPFHISATYYHALQYILPNLDGAYIKKTQSNTNILYSPFSWMTAGFQWTKDTDESAKDVNTNNGRAYGTSIYLTFNNIQDCLNIILERRKLAGTPENQSTYLIGMSLKIFGFTTAYQNLVSSTPSS